jgi:hypothetical protein
MESGDDVALRRYSQEEAELAVKIWQCQFLAGGIDSFVRGVL